MYVNEKLSTRDFEEKLKDRSVLEINLQRQQLDLPDFKSGVWC
jgi:hypothetical protein